MKKTLCTLAFVICTTGFGSAALSQIQSWQAGPGETDFGDVVNWTSAVPDEASIAAIGPHSNAINSSIFLDQNRTIGAMLISDGMTLNTNAHTLTVNNLNAGGLAITGNNSFSNLSFPSQLEVVRTNNSDPIFNPDLLVNGELRVVDGARLSGLNKPNIRINDASFRLGEDSVFTGSATLNVFTSPGETAVINDGTIRSAANGEIVIHTNGVLDLDGVSELGQLDASQPGSNISFGSGLIEEAFDGLITIGPESTVIFANSAQGLTLGQAAIRFQGTEDEPARFVFVDNFQGSSVSSELLADGHGLISGFDGGHLLGEFDINVSEDSSLTFENLVAEVSGGWTVANNSVLDLQDTHASSSSNKVVLQGGLIKGEGSETFKNTHAGGIRGFGRFELEFRNDTVIAAEGGTLVLAGTNNNNDFDGINDTGQLLAVDGDLHIIDHGSEGADFVLIGPGRKLIIEETFVSYGGTFEIQGGQLISNDDQSFFGDLIISQPSAISALTSFQQGANVQLQADLLIADGYLYVLKNADVTGPGDLHIGSEAELNLLDEAVLDVDLVNEGIMWPDFGAGIQVVINGNLENRNRIEFRLAGTGAEEYTQIEIADSLVAESGLFSISLVDGFQPGASDEFDILDFQNFQNHGYSLNLPELWPGLEWDISDFEYSGTLRVGGFMLGDVNLDGVVDLLDVDPFVQLVTNSNYQVEADFNQDGVVNLLDAAPFIDLLST